MAKILTIKNLNAKVENKEILKNFNLELEKGNIHVIMGPNGSGKSTLANAIMGHPNYSAKGSVKLNTEELLSLDPDERSKKGIFLSFQYPVAIPGVTVSNFLRQAINARREKNDEIKIPEFVKKLNKQLEILHIPKEFSRRYLNEGFSGGEKKKMEILQLAMLEPKVAILDETDSGLDIDALKKVCEAINIVKKEFPDMTLLIITHYQRMLNYLNPDTIHVMLNGNIVKTGGPELAQELEKKGYSIIK
ncbi:Fe-S cluster assembly ATPase SufC [Candidatus Woesearchaeota archaeon]|nr:Fe-S cluster assembly ATPase SufC [Candidatus Woesearchaeota archaeon]MCF7901055.1 Fe-S cluster assembly ATPase SufC [Candidatus Woesearchaeota archaeon]MCF8013952.1 Fe-S cluster assembly ATPase SufC [Candidatus Woesearchaeota archaeon]